MARTPVSAPAQALNIRFERRFDTAPANILGKFWFGIADCAEIGPFTIWASKKDGSRFVTAPAEKYTAKDGKVKYFDHFRATSDAARPRVDAFYAEVLKMFVTFESAGAPNAPAAAAPAEPPAFVQDL